MLNLRNARLLQTNQSAELEMTVILKDMVRSYEADENTVDELYTKSAFNTQASLFLLSCQGH